MILVPTEYVGMARTRYLDDLARLTPPEIPIGWTGPAVVNDSITADEARARADALGGRAPLIWDNYPVNDATMADRLHLGPLWGRDHDLLGRLLGLPGQPDGAAARSRLPLASIAALAAGRRPAHRLGRGGRTRCGCSPRRATGGCPARWRPTWRRRPTVPQWASAARPLAEWLAAAAACEAPGLEEEAAEWLRQVHREARLGLSALRLIQAGRPVVTVDDNGVGRIIPPQADAVLAEALLIGGRWPSVRRSEHTVMGPRCSFRPMLRQRPDGDWIVARAAIEEGQNAIDALVRSALETLDDAPVEVGPVELLVEGERVDVDRRGSVRGRTRGRDRRPVRVRCGPRSARPCTPVPVPERA